MCLKTPNLTQMRGAAPRTENATPKKRAKTLKKNSPVERGSLGAVDIVPPVAGELLLIEQCAIGAQESSTLVTFASIMANVVRLKLHIIMIAPNCAGRKTAPNAFGQFKREKCALLHKKQTAK
jgi:hypothetical protein